MPTRTSTPPTSVRLHVAVVLLVTLLAALMHVGEAVTPPSEQQAVEFLEQFEAGITKISRDEAIAEWHEATNITEYNAQRALEAGAVLAAYVKQALADAAPFLEPSALRTYSATTQRKFQRLRLHGGDPKDPSKRDRLASLIQEMEGIYASAKYKGMNLDPGLEAIISDPVHKTYAELLDVWLGWRDAVGPRVKPLFEEYVTLSNLGATDSGFKDASEFWLAGYDLTTEEFRAQIEELWKTIRPLYVKLHAYVRFRLAKHFGADKVPADKPIPAHILGNMWAQSWSNVMPLVAPFPDEPAIDITGAMEEQNYDAERMHRLSISFYDSIGLGELPSSFWNNSMLVRPPPPRDVVCHASAWDMGRDENGELDLRIKMCTKVNQEDLFTIHHEQGHLYYDKAYSSQPFLFRNGIASFHEAVGDTIRLSVNTPGHLAEIGLLPESQAHMSREAVVNYQMSVALDKISFLPFGLLIDKYRWSVFEGKIAPDEYNAEWWHMRREFQGVASPVSRSEEDFDPGAKYHVPASTPYIRYFLADLLQFDFHRALCNAAEHEGPLYNCSVYNSKPAGSRLNAMLKMGVSKPWMDALDVIAGHRAVDAGAMTEYFEPLTEWLDEQIMLHDIQVGWSTSDGDKGDDDGSGVSTATIVAVVLVVVIVASGIIYCLRRANAASKTDYIPYNETSSNWHELVDGSDSINNRSDYIDDDAL